MSLDNSVILWKYPNAMPGDDFLVRDDNDGTGAHLVMWNVKDASGNAVPEPTQTNLDDWLLGAAKQARITYLQQKFAISLLEGFTSNADGTTRTYAIDPAAMSKWTGALGNVNSGKQTSVTLKDFNGNKITLTGAQFQQMASDGFAFFNNQESHLWGKEDNVNAVLRANYPTAQDAVNAVNAVAW